MKILTLLTCPLAIGGCASVGKLFSSEPTAENRAPIMSPFEGYGPDAGSKPAPVVLRTRKGDRSVEVELPADQGDLSEFVVPISPAFRDERDANRESANIDSSAFRERAPSITDREITSQFPQGAGSPEDEARRREIETGLGLMPSEDSAPAADRSYLAALDHVKRLYKAARYEAGLLELDEMLRAYPTDPTLYEMRGTLLDRLGRGDLALKSWNQSIRLNPGNESLRRFVDRKQQKRSLASP